MAFTWIIENISSLTCEKIYSDEFVIGGCKWRLKALSKGNNTTNEFSLYLAVADAEYLPFGWRRHAKFLFTMVNQISEEFVLWEEHWFDEKDPERGYTSKVFLAKPKAENGGFMVNEDVKIVVEVEVLEVIGILDVLEESETRVNDDAAVSYYSPKETRPDWVNVNWSRVLPYPEYEYEYEYEEEYEERSEMEEESEEANRPRKKTKGNNNSAVSSASWNETMDVNGFQVLPSQVNLVRRIFKKYPDIASEFKAKNQYLKTSCMNVLLSIMETLCQSSQELSNEDITEAHNALVYVKDAGLKVDWLEKKLEEVMEKKKEEQICETRVQEFDKKLKDCKQKWSDIEAKLEKEKAKLFATRAHLTLDDFV